MTDVLVLEEHAEIYGTRLRAEFPALHVVEAKNLRQLPSDLSSIDVLLAFGVAINDGILANAKNLQWIQSLATGVDHFLRCPSLRPQVILTSARGIHGPAMRESVAHLMLTLSRDTPRLVRNQAAHRWDRGPPWPLLCGKTAVVAGIGIGGIAVGQLLKGFGMRVIGVSRTPRTIDGFDVMVHTDRIIEAAAEADYLINILPGSDENLGLFGRAIFDAMKPTAFFVNVGRGQTVDEAALIDCLRSNRIAGAGLDVFQMTPLPADSPLWDLPNVFVSPHIGGHFSEYEDYVLPLIIANMRLFVQGRHGEMRNVVSH